MTSTETTGVALPSPAHRPTPPSSPVEKHPPPTAKALKDTPTTLALVSDAERLVTALEKLMAAKAVPHTTSALETKKPPAKEGDLQVARASKLEYKRVDEVWDEKSGKYQVVESADSGSNELDQYVFIVRERIDKNTLDTTSFVDIKSTLLRDILEEICQDIRNVSLADVTPSIERKVLFYICKELKLYHKRIADDPQLSTAEKHLRLLVNYTESTHQSTIEHLSVLLKKREITYGLLWAIFEPNVELYTTCKGTDAPRCIVCNHCEEKTKRDGSKYLYVDARYLNTDGKVLGEATAGIEIDCFQGAKRIELLPAYPLKYHPEQGKVREELIQCGRKFVSLMGIHHRQYEGKAFFIDEEGEIVGRYVRGRIMVDAICFQDCKPNYPCPRVRKVKPRYTVFGVCGAIKLADIDPRQLNEHEVLICSPTVLGFCLGSKTFLEFAVANISDIEWSQSSFNDVKIPESQKMPIRALTETYLRRAPGEGFKDLVQGKGRGINFLLYGPPGVGKTLTAETMAETIKIPLYTVAAGQIGVEPVKVETILTSIFKIVSRWKAILLLDEADVFLAQRADNPQLNALVSVFLRELEQYDGILFLTTNRVQSFDEAMISRIHLALKYDPLGRDARKAVWRYFLDQAETKKGRPAFHQSVIDDLAEKNLNGREIRNAVFIAWSIAEYQNMAVSEVHLKNSVATRDQFHLDFQGAGAVGNVNSYL